MTVLNRPDEYEYLRESGRIVKAALDVLQDRLRPGLTTAFLDEIAEEVIKDNRGKPAFKGYRGYPSTICVSVNDVVVHGIPSRDKVIEEEDLVSIDVGVEKNGFFADAARTFCMSNAPERALKLADTTFDCLQKSVSKAVAGGYVGDISAVVENIARENGYQEVRAFVGHGLGRRLHEDPEVPNWGKPGTGPRLPEGLVLAVEPMLNEGRREVEIADDDWTAFTKDGKLSAHFEHTIVVGKEKPEIIA